ncbi:MAG: hypothetical protein R3B72_05895 [Polyangiaceae bacterium]
MTIVRRPPEGLTGREVLVDLLASAAQEPDPLVATALVAHARSIYGEIPYVDDLGAALEDIALSVAARARQCAQEVTRVSFKGPS